MKARDYLPNNFTLHCLRHSFGYILALAGVEMYEIQKAMRHKTIQMTIDTYGHLTQEDVKNITDIFD